MGIWSKLFCGGEREEKVDIHPNSNSIKLAEVVLPMFELSRMGVSYLIDPVLQSAQNRKFIWAYFYGFVVGMGMGYRMSVSEVENGAFLVFQKFFNMTKNEAACAVGVVQSMSDTEVGLKWMTEGQTSAVQFMTKKYPVPINPNDLAFLISDLG